MANVKISDLTAAASVEDANEFEINEAGTSKKVTGAQISTKVRGDITSTDVQTAGALMDSELTNITAVKALDQGVATTDSPQFAGVNVGHATDTTITRTGAGVIAVEGVEVTTNSATQTLTNKTLTNPAVTAPTMTGTIIEDVYAWTTTTGTVTDEMEPANGSIQTLTLTGNITSLTDNIASGEAITLMVDDGSAYTITWPTMTWVNNGGSAPTLATSGYTVVALWKVSTTLYGALVGDGT
jgi:hypothetical protein